MSANVERLTNRLASTPPVFRGRASGEDALRIDAVVADLVRDRGTRPLEPDEVARFILGAATPARHLELVLVASWLLHDEAFAGSPTDALLALLDGRLAELATLVVPRLFVEDAERREELVRTCLAALDRVPEGETPVAAEDRLAVLDSVRRKALLRDARAREDAREVERKKRKAELERLRLEEEEAQRQAARTTHED
ncbi:MAG: hypothetical protein NT062_25160 [Proteobacteria bacterium]|nr:hypothetical protein [Pseudomonadota bacterium]